MEIRLNKEWVIYSSKNESGVILGKIPQKNQDEYSGTENFQGVKHHYSTVFGAVQGAFKYGLISCEAKSFSELESMVTKIANECQAAFNAESLKVLKDEKVAELQAEIAKLKAKKEKK